MRCLVWGAAFSALGIATYSLPAMGRSLESRWYHDVYERGRYVSSPDAGMKRDEEYARSNGGHMPWRQDPLLTAQVLAGDLLRPPHRAGKWTERSVRGRRTLAADDVQWLLISEHDGKALVRALVRGRATAEVRLIRPFGYWWYVSSARRTDTRASKAVVIHPDGAREFLRGPVLLVRGRAYLPARDLDRVQLGVEWHTEKHTLALYVPDSDNIAWYRPGRPFVYADPDSAHGHPITWSPLMRQGRIFVPASDIAKWFRTFIAAWDLQSSRLHLYIQPFKTAGPSDRKEAGRPSIRRPADPGCSLVPP